MRPRIGDKIHYTVTDPNGGNPLPCRLAFVTEVPTYLLREPLDGCPNGTGGEWIASLAAVGRTGLVFEEDVDYLHPGKSDAVDWAEHVATSWHTATDCEEG